MCRVEVADLRSTSIVRGFAGIGGRERRAPVAEAGPKLEFDAQVCRLVGPLLEKFAFFHCRWLERFGRVTC